jgi:D-glycero-D-manno-heptose 1,7-bisphosphate phosphatase
MNTMNRAIFLDRDGVLIKDTDLITSEEDICILPDVCNALRMFVLMQYKLIVVSNQPVVARGLLDEEGVVRLHTIITHLIAIESTILLDDFFFCPHHPDATVEKYRTACTCRKPEPGMILEASKKHNIDLPNSYMIGDRITDCIAGSKAGCTTVQVCTGKHTADPIISSSEIDLSYKPDFTCDTLFDAAKWIGYR